MDSGMFPNKLFTSKYLFIFLKKKNNNKKILLIISKLLQNLLF